MILRYPCEGCGNEIIGELDNSNKSGTYTAPAYCIECRESNPYNQLVVKTAEELQEELSIDNIDKNGDDN